LPGTSAKAKHTVKGGNDVGGRFPPAYAGERAGRVSVQPVERHHFSTLLLPKSHHDNDNAVVSICLMGNFTILIGNFQNGE
jgi:hypothetical protein